tara:strand:- start:126 stop:380 length:255 start_codon:yes stop_codon:yes gene_type:complete
VVHNFSGWGKESATIPSVGSQLEGLGYYILEAVQGLISLQFLPKLESFMSPEKVLIWRNEKVLFQSVFFVSAETSEFPCQKGGS